MNWQDFQIDFDFNNLYQKNTTKMLFIGDIYSYNDETLMIFNLNIERTYQKDFAYLITSSFN